MTFYDVVVLKDRVQYFSMQVVINKCFLLNPVKNFWRRSVLSFWQKRKKCTLWLRKMMLSIQRLDYY